jgi:hypothetical protein
MNIGARQWSGIAALVGGLALVVAGCGPAMSTVSGNVTVDGKPLEKGAISYVPADNQGSPVTVDVAGGKYELQILAGKKMVQISAPFLKEKKKRYEGPDAPYDEFFDESLPAKYNSETTLTFDVQPGKNTKDWAVESQKPK